MSASRHRYTPDGCLCGCPCAAYMAERLEKAREGVAQLDDYFGLGEILFHTSNRFPFAEKVIKHLLRTSLNKRVAS